MTKAKGVKSRDTLMIDLALQGGRVAWRIHMGCSGPLARGSLA